MSSYIKKKSCDFVVTAENTGKVLALNQRFLPDALYCFTLDGTGSIVDVKVEIQIRTVAMDFWASLEHKINYKFEGRAPEHIRRELVECAKMVSQLDARMLALNEEIQTLGEEKESGTAGG